MDYLEKLPKVWQEKWRELGFQKPSLIQERSFDLLREGESVSGISPTGTGKTLAYLLPLLLNVEKGAGNQLLILVSSQELAMQVVKVAREWGELLKLTVCPIIGGANAKRQEEKLKKRPEIVVGTPGRVFELIQSKKIKLMQVNAIVLDEVDQLFAGNGIALAQRILDYVPKDFQLSFFSATGEVVLEKIKELAGENIVLLDVSREDDSKGEAEHFYLQVAQRQKIDLLRRLTHLKDFRAIVFFNQLSDLGNAEEKLLYLGLSVASLASDQDKIVRKAALEKFKKGEIQLLLTTDVLSRGLDIASLPYVVNFDVPLSKESYTHRSGRTARMGAKGRVVTLHSEVAVKDLKKRVPVGNSLTEIFLWGGQLLTESPKKEKSGEESLKQGRPKASPKKEILKSKKKNKKKAQKDKGAPKKKR